MRGTYRVRAALRVLEVAETQYSAQKGEGGSEGAGGLARGDVLRVEVNNRLGSSAIMPDEIVVKRKLCSEWANKG
jgi:hypothetical protein